MSFDLFNASLLNNNIYFFKIYIYIFWIVVYYCIHKILSSSIDKKKMFLVHQISVLELFLKDSVIIMNK